MKNAFPFVRTELPDWMVPVIEKVAAKMHDDATGHDLLHAVRVMELAGAIAKELGVEKEPTMTAGLLHDYYRKEEKQSGQLHYGPEAIAALRQEFGSMIAEALGKDGLEDVLAAIARHEEYYFDQDQGEDVLALPVLLQILQDADRIEAIGAVGVARTFMFGGAHGLPLAEDAEINANTWFDPGTRPKGSVHQHFYEKLLRLKDGMHTAPGRKLAEERHQFMLMFVRQLESELELESPDAVNLAR